MGVVLARAEVVQGLEPLANFTAANVRAVFEQFDEVCPTPALWGRAFFELFNCWGSHEACQKAFRVLDTDSNGLVDGRELLGSLAVMSKGHLTERMELLFDIFDLNKEREITFDECFILLRRAMAGLRKMIGILMPPEKVVHNMVKQVWKVARKHRDNRITPDDWREWWSHDTSLRSALKMVTWRPEEQRGLPTPDQWVNTDYTKSVKLVDEKGGDDGAESGIRRSSRRRSADSANEDLDAKQGSAMARGKS